MDGCKLSSDEVVARLLEMGFHNSAVRQAVNDVGPSFDGALDYLLNGSHEKLMAPSVTPTGDGITRGKRMSASSQFIGPMRQSSISDHFHSAGSTMPKRARTGSSSDLRLSRMNQSMETLPKAETLPFSGIQRVADVGSDWEERANTLLLKHFGYPSLKGFQKEALAAWVANRDCLVLAATGSGKSLCFQLPALLTRKVVVVISPLISLMHDQCLKLSKHGVSACFLGSGQPDSTVERKAMKGLHDIIYVCPETVLRLIKPLQGLAESRGIALFAIDEVHCVSKWGHDFRPDYRRLSVLRESFSASNLNFLQFDVPLMALTATATIQVREDILNSLRLSKGTKIVLTSFFRSNLRFSVKHSRTSSPSSYAKDFQDLIDAYARKRKIDINKQNVISKESDDCSVCSSDDVLSDADVSLSETNSDEDYCSDRDNDEVNTKGENGSTAPNQRKMSVDYLENEVDVFQNVDDCDVACGECCGRSPCEEWDTCGSFKTIDPPDKLEERSELQQESLDEGPTIIYVPTRKETLKIAKYLCRFGVKAAAYNASLPKSHLRQVHREFHDNTLQVVVATVAFGMGIDKLNVRRIIHYGWPQSLEAYYQEAGRAGRDENLADCILYANLSRVPTLLPSRRSEDQTNQAYKMLSDCFKYGMNTSYCRAKILVEYFGEDFSNEKCLLCDVCVYGPPAMENVKAEAKVFMEIIAAHHEQSNSLDCSYDEMNPDTNALRSIQKPNLRMLISKIREQSQQYLATDQLWWRGLARILEDKGYIREGDEKTSAHIKFPTPTKLGLEFLQFETEQPFYVYPEADMLLSVKKQKSYSTFADWGKGWADPAIRRQRLESIRLDRKPGKQRKPRMRKSRKAKPDISTARGRIAAKLLKQKR